jgi:hypothetical protein
MFDESGERSRSHALPPRLMQAQAEALGIPLVMRQASWTDYEAVFTDQLQRFAAEGITHGLFGDIDLQAHRDWEEKVCGAAGIVAALPLWQEPRRALVDELFSLGYRSRVVCVDARFLDAGFCGREFNASSIADLPAGVDACGENGEFHTFVFDSPRGLPGPDRARPTDRDAAARPAAARAARCRGGEFPLQAVRPTFDLHPFSVNGQPQADGKSVRLWAADHDGWLTMDATATLR